MKLSFRLVEIKDAKILFEWRNHPETRQSSINSDEIKWQDHLRWLDKSLVDSNRKIFIVYDEETPIGTIRKDTLNPEVSELSWTVSPDLHGKGYGTQMLIEFCKIESGNLIARIKKDNLASQRMVQRAGFTLATVENNIGCWSKK